MANSKKTKRISKKVLKNYFYNLAKPSAFAGPLKLKQQLNKDGYKVSLKQVRQFLASQPTYVLYRRALNKYPRRASVSTLMKPGLVIYADLWDMSKYQDQNSGYRWIAVFIGKLVF